MPFLIILFGILLILFCVLFFLVWQALLFITIAALYISISFAIVEAFEDSASALITGIILACGLPAILYFTFNSHLHHWWTMQMPFMDSKDTIYQGGPVESFTHSQSVKKWNIAKNSRNCQLSSYREQNFSITHFNLTLDRIHCQCNDTNDCYPDEKCAIYSGVKGNTLYKIRTCVSKDFPETGILQVP